MSLTPLGQTYLNYESFSQEWFWNSKVQLSSQKLFALKTESITGIGLQHNEFSIKRISKIKMAVSLS